MEHALLRRLLPSRGSFRFSIIRVYGFADFVKYLPRPLDRVDYDEGQRSFPMLFPRESRHFLFVSGTAFNRFRLRNFLDGVSARGKPFVGEVGGGKLDNRVRRRRGMVGSVKPIRVNRG